MRQRVFLVGASGVGKSTLGKLLAHDAGLEFVSISGSPVYQRHDTTVAAAFADPALMGRVQADIPVYTAERLEACAELPGYVSDRGFDLSVYGALLGFPHRPEAIERIIAAMHKLPLDGSPVRVTTVFVRPNRRVLTAARLADDGRRAAFLSDPWVYRVDGALEFFIRSRGLPVVELPEVVDDMNARLSLVREAAGLPSWRPREAAPAIPAGFGAPAAARAARTH